MRSVNQTTVLIPADGLRLVAVRKAGMLPLVDRLERSLARADTEE